MLRAFLGAPSGIVGLVVLGFIIFGAFVAPQILGSRRRSWMCSRASGNPAAARMLGTDNLGRDIFAESSSRHGCRSASPSGGRPPGPRSDDCGGPARRCLGPRLRSIALRAIDALLAFPALLVAIFVARSSGPAASTGRCSVSASRSRSRSPESRARSSLAIAGRDYIAAARSLGISGPRRMTRYVLPNIAETLAITSTVNISNSIATVSSLSFLGLGVQAPDFDWGRMLTEGTQAFYLTPAAALAPATRHHGHRALAFGFSGEAIARAMNPVLWVATRRPRRTALHAGHGRSGRAGKATRAGLRPPRAQARLARGARPDRHVPRAARGPSRS